MLNAPRSLVLLGALLILGSDMPAQVVVTDRGLVVSDLPDHRKMARQEIAIECGSFGCTLVFSNTDYCDTNGVRLRTDAMIGVGFRDRGKGWYAGNTIWFLADGVGLTGDKGKLRDTRILEQGPAAIIETTVDHPKACVRVRLALRPGQDAIDVQAAFQPREAVQQFEAWLHCFPACMTVADHRRGDRWVVTPERAVEEIREPNLDPNAREWAVPVRHEDLDPSRDWWLFYYDKFFNSPDGGIGQGMCGLVVRPDDLKALALDVTSYHIFTVLKAKPGHSVIRFSLWQNGERDYQPALNQFKPVVAAAKARLDQPFLFTPGRLSGFDETAERLVLTNAVTNTAELTNRLAQVACAVAQFKAAPPASGFEAEARADEALKAYRHAVWKARRGAPRALRILALAGPHFPEWKLDEVKTIRGQPVTLDKCFFSASAGGERLSGFPATETEMLRYDAVVLVNVGVASLRKTEQNLLKQFVSGGGGLIVCGGFYAYSGAEFAGSVLEEILPVSVKGSHDLKRLPAAAELACGVGTAGLEDLVWDNRSAVMWLHDLRVKPGAEVALVAREKQGERPFLVLGRYGEGRVAALAGTVYGVPPDGRTEFWNDPAWPVCLARVVRWVCGESR